MMAKIRSDVLQRKRGKVLNHARALARSGGHADHQSIISHVAALEDFEAVRRVFEDRAICAQLDLLCAFAREAAPELTSRPSRRGMHKLICEESRT
jgi:hypothetical protein